MSTVSVMFYHAVDPSNTFLFESQMPFVPRVGEHVSISYNYQDGGLAYLDWEVVHVEWCLSDPSPHPATVEVHRPLFMVSINLKPIGVLDPYGPGVVPLDDLNEEERAVMLPGGLG